MSEEILTKKGLVNYIERKAEESPNDADLVMQYVEGCLDDEDENHEKKTQFTTGELDEALRMIKEGIEAKAEAN